MLTFVLFQAPCSLAPLALSVALSWEQGIWEAVGVGLAGDSSVAPNASHVRPVFLVLKLIPSHPTGE